VVLRFVLTGRRTCAYPNIERWLGLVAAQVGYRKDVEPYPANAKAGAGSSIYGSS